MQQTPKSNDGIASIHDLARTSPDGVANLVDLAWSAINSGNASLAAHYLYAAIDGAPSPWRLRCKELADWLLSAEGVEALPGAVWIEAKSWPGYGRSFDAIRLALGAIELSVVFSLDLRMAAFQDARPNSRDQLLNQRATERLFTGSNKDGRARTPVYGDAVVAPVRDYVGLNLSPEQAADQLLGCLAIENARILRDSPTRSSSGLGHPNEREGSL